MVWVLLDDNLFLILPGKTNPDSRMGHKLSGLVWSYLREHNLWTSVRLEILPGQEFFCPLNVVS